MTAGVVFRDPPPARNGGRDWAAVAAEVKRQPGRWAFLGDLSTAICGRIMGGRAPGFDGEWQFTTRSLPGTTRRDFYARYLGASTTTDLSAHVDFGKRTTP